jgi:hypothetical protein
MQIHLNTRSLFRKRSRGLFQGITEKIASREICHSAGTLLSGKGSSGKASQKKVGGMSLEKGLF